MGNVDNLRQVVRSRPTSARMTALARRSILRIWRIRLDQSRLGRGGLGNAIVPRTVLLAFDEHPLEKLAVLVLEEAYRRTLVRCVLKMLLEELKTCSILLDQFAPGLDPNGDVGSAHD